MAIPLAYNLRNLKVRKTATLMTALGIGLTVSVLLLVMALVTGMRAAFRATGSPLNVLVTRQGANSELASNLTRAQFQDLKFKPGIAHNAAGEPLASLELVSLLSLESADAPSGVNITLRGLSPLGVELRDNLKIVQGRWFTPGQREVVVGKSVAARNPSAQMGRQIFFGRGNWTVVGVMDGGDSATDSEIWADLNQASGDLNRLEVLSSALVRAQDAGAVPALIDDLRNDQRLAVSARTEREYYDSQTSSAGPLLFMGIFIAAIMAIGSGFAAMNTMYAAVARRAREIGTLRVLGFSRRSILLSFFIEALLLAILGGVLGCLLVLPFNGVTTAVGNQMSTVAVSFRVTPQIMFIGVLFAAVVGGTGGLLPAGAAARKEILAALRGT